MKLLFIAAAVGLAFGSQTLPASAACYGSSSLSTCYDSSGNSYTVNRMGNSTFVYGQNSQTGSSWSQDSYTLGNSTFTYGRSANGNSWNMTTTPYGTYGQNSAGRSFYCDAYGNCN